jgi:hypothetical protein
MPGWYAWKSQSEEYVALPRLFPPGRLTPERRSRPTARQSHRPTVTLAVSGGCGDAKMIPFYSDA